MEAVERKSQLSGKKGSTQGFTLVEMLIAVVIVGILSAIAVPKIAGTKDRGYVATMKSDLRNFATAEESYFYDNAVYVGDLTTLVNRGFRVSPGVVLTISEATAAGWSATVRHNLSSFECALLVGNAAPISGAADDGVMVCQ